MVNLPHWFVFVPAAVGCMCSAVSSRNRKHKASQREAELHAAEPSQKLNCVSITATDSLAQSVGAGACGDSGAVCTVCSPSLRDAAQDACARALCTNAATNEEYNQCVSTCTSECMRSAGDNAQSVSLS